MKIIPLSEGTFTVDKTKQFIPFHSNDKLQERPSGSLLVEIQPFVVITEKDVLLLDTGLGFSNANGKMQVHENLVINGIEPSSVTKVLISHLHKDHSGGVSQINDHNKLNFPNAKYYLQKKELDLAFVHKDSYGEKSFTSYITGDLIALKDAEQVVFLSDNKGIIDEYINYEVTAAHSPFHQVFWIKENLQIIFFGGDDAPQLQQMKHKFVAKYDFDGKRTMQLRQEWWKRGQKEKWTFLFYHDVKNPVWQF